MVICILIRVADSDPDQSLERGRIWIHKEVEFIGRKKVKMSFIRLDLDSVFLDGRIRFFLEGRIQFGNRGHSIRIRNPDICLMYIPYGAENNAIV